MTRVLLTGATSGIGLAAAALLAPVAELIAQGPEVRRPGNLDPGIRYIPSDFTRLSAVRELAAAVLDDGPPDVVINNAGIPGPRVLTTSDDGIELTFQVNYLAGALLTELLLPHLAPDARIVNVASATHYSATLDLDDLGYERSPYDSVGAYARSKLAIVARTCSLSSRLPQTLVSVHPGVLSTGLLHAMFGLVGAPVALGAESIVHAVEARVPSGTYLDERAPAAPNPLALDPAFQRRLDALTERLLS